MDDLAQLDARLRDAQNRALLAWHMYELERENAEGRWPVRFDRSGL